jgi:hypothetical protein
MRDQLMFQLDESDDPSEQCLFITAIQDRLDIVLTLYEVAHASLNGWSRHPHCRH